MKKKNTWVNPKAMISQLREKLKREPDPIEREYISQRIEHYTRLVKHNEPSNDSEHTT